MIHLLTTLALADAVSLDSSLDCPRGSFVTASHSGSWCQPEDCNENQCSSGTCVQDVGLCVTRTETPCGGMSSDSGECTFEKVEAHDTCKSDDDCSQGSCEIADRCTSATQACSGCATPASAGLGLLLLGLAALFRRTT